MALITGVLKMDKETAADTYKIVQESFNDTGVPTPEGIGNIIRAIRYPTIALIGKYHACRGCHVDWAAS